MNLEMAEKITQRLRAAGYIPESNTPNLDYSTLQNVPAKTPKRLPKPRKVEKVGNVTYLYNRTQNLPSETELLRQHFRNNYESALHEDMHMAYLIALDLPTKTISQITEKSLPYVNQFRISKRGRTLIDTARDEYAKIFAHTSLDFALKAHQFLENLITGEIPGATLPLRAFYANLAVDRGLNLDTKTNIKNPKLKLRPQELEQVKDRLTEIIQKVHQLNSADR